jgi:hypothetical protein
VLEDDSHKAAQFEAVQIQAGLRRRWLYLMPVVFVTYSLAYLGRSNFGFGAAARLGFLSRLFSLSNSRGSLCHSQKCDAAGLFRAHQLGNLFRADRNHPQLLVAGR